MGIRQGVCGGDNDRHEEIVETSAGGGDEPYGSDFNVFVKVS